MSLFANLPYQTPSVRAIFWLSGLFALFISFAGIVLMTDIGQVIAAPRGLIVTYYQYSAYIIGLCILVYGIFAWTSLKNDIVRPWIVMLCGVGVAAGLFASNFMNPVIFPSKLRGADYTTIAEAAPDMAANDRIYVVEIGGEAVGYPQKYLEIPHIAGATIGGQDVAMTYCALSHVPVVYDQVQNGQQLDLTVLGQTNNNLIMVDHTSGDLIQQVTGKTDFNQSQLTSVPNQMMPWSVFTTLYPNARVFHYPSDRVIDKILNAIFDDGLKQHYDPAAGPLFPTLRMDDIRLPMKEQVWGVDLNGEQIAFARSFFDTSPVANLEIGGEPVAIVMHQPEGFVGLYSRRVGGQVVTVDSIDVFGNTPDGKLEKLPMHNGILWMVWSHFFPHTAVQS